MQVDLMKGYSRKNKEMTSLFADFNEMAKILAVGHYSSLTETSYQSLFNLHQAVDVFLSFKNYRNAGACYMNLGCLVTRQSMVEYAKAKEYIDTAIYIQENIIKQNLDQNLINHEQSDDKGLNSERMDSARDASEDKGMMNGDLAHGDSVTDGYMRRVNDAGIIKVSDVDA